MKSQRKAFTLAELIVGVVFLVVVLGPLLLFVSRIQDLNNAIGQEARSEAWRSFNDQVVATGIDPGLAPGLSPAKNAAVPVLSAPRVRQVAGAPTAGIPAVVALQIVQDDPIPERRLLSAGLQLGAGSAVAPRKAPVPPLPPVVMPPPLVAPADGTIVDVASLVPGAPDEPFTLAITSTSSAGTRVRARTNTSATAGEGLGSLLVNVTATDLLTGVRGLSWTEYPGTPENGDRAVKLDDGRTRWLVTTADGRVQTYEPSDIVPFAYRFDLGTPVLVRGTEEITSGASVSFDYAQYSSIRGGMATLRVDYARATRIAFGKAWAAQALGFKWMFGRAAGPFSGDVACFFQPDRLSDWGDTVTVTASGVVPANAISSSATWSLVRAKTTLGTPVISTAADVAGFYTPGSVDFSVPLAGDGTAIGRLSFEDGTYLSTGASLSITLVP